MVPSFLLGLLCFFLGLCEATLCSLSILSVLLYFFHLSKLLYALWVSFLPNFFHLSEASLCYPLRLQALCYFLTFSETTLSSWSSFWLSLVSQALQSCFVLWDSLNLSTSSLASPKLLWLPCRLFSLFLPLTEVTLEHFQAFCCISTPPLFWS